jgi:ArsR family transcriptional regulator
VAVFSESDATVVGKALSDPSRLRIYIQIARHKELFVGELEACRVISHATISHHLRILTQAGLITFRRSGQYVFYRAIRARLREYCRYLSGLGKSALFSEAIAPKWTEQKQKLSSPDYSLPH